MKQEANLRIHFWHRQKPPTEIKGTLRLLMDGIERNTEWICKEENLVAWCVLLTQFVLSAGLVPRVVGGIRRLVTL
jgi:hypothetical protein